MTRSIRRRSALRLIPTLMLAGGASLATTALAQAPTYPIPGKPIRIVLPFPAGSGTDGNVRVIARLMQEALGGHPVIVDNKPGAGTMIGAQEVARAAPDGHTLLYTIVITHTQNPHLYAKLPYDPFKDFTPLTQVMKSATVLIAHPSVPASNMGELVEYAKANPGKLNFASFSPGSTSHLNGEMLMQRTGIKMVHVPYKGTPEAGRAIVSGEVQLYFDGTTTAIPLIRAGRVKALGAATPTRVSVLPEVPTISEQGVPGIDIVGWQGLFAPGNMPTALTERVSAVLRQVVTSPEMLKVIAQQGAEPSGVSPSEFAAIVRRDHDRWGEVIRNGNIKIE